MRARIKPTKLVLLAILDGWGIAPAGPSNALSQANIPNFKRFMAAYPHTQLVASGESVGLPRGEVGSTETGHLNMGAGRIVYQDLVRINLSIADGSFFQNEALLGAFEHVKRNNSKLHFIGLVGAGGVHSNIAHLFALIQMAARHEFKNVFVHVFTDGRDSPPRAAVSYIKQLEDVMRKEGVGKIASITGRYWAMDRDQKWDRTAKAYFALTKGDGRYVKNATEAIETSYTEGKTDEFIEPSLIGEEEGKPLALIESNDAVIFFNYRIDRPRQLSRAFVLDDIAVTNQAWGFDPYTVKYKKKHKVAQEPPPMVIHRGKKLDNLYFAMMTEYGKYLADAGAHSAFPPEVVNMPLGQVLSLNNLKQLRAAESEKERFLTYYFNGQVENAYPGEERLVIPSPDVETYDLKPEMSAEVLTDSVLARIKEGGYSFVALNFANADMVGHTGNLKAAIQAVQVVDANIGRLAKVVTALGGVMLITADHGNVEGMINSETGGIDTEHSSTPVPFIVIGKQFAGNPRQLKSGILGDIAPTVLALLGIAKPTQMTGRNLLEDLMR